MPELPDITAYIESLDARIQGKQLKKALTFNPFVLRSYDPPLAELEGKTTQELRRIGKRIVLGFGEELFLVVHLMIAGRLRWQDAPATALKARGKIALAALEFESGVLTLTEVSTKKRASLTAVRGEQSLKALDPGGLEPLTCTFPQFRWALSLENRTLKRVLTNPRTFSGIGNAYSDEILHAARLSPLRLTGSLTEEETQRLFEATRSTLQTLIERLRAEFAQAFPGPGQITAFRPDFAAHGKFGQPCPTCGAPIQRIVYAENETNYCAACQNEGRLLADRALSRLLKQDWPRTLEELVGE